MATASVEAPRIGDTLNQAWKNDKSKFGLKMLQKMGWTEGKGLGKREDGVSEHVKVAKKSNNLGLGATHDASGAAGWASAAVSFNGVLEALGKAYGGDGAAAAGRKKRKGDKKAKKKSKKAEKRRREKGNDGAAGDSSSSSGGEGGVGASASAQEPSSCPSRARRVKSKDVKGFSAADLRAILGQAATTANPSLPSYPVIGGGYGSGAASAAASVTEPKATKKSSPSKKRKTPSAETPPHRPRTRSMDDTAAVAQETSKPGKRPRQPPSSDHEEGDRKEGGRNAGAGEAAPAPTLQPKKSKKKKKAGAGGGSEEPVAVVARVSKDKRRLKRSNKEKSQ